MQLSRNTTRPDLPLFLINAHKAADAAAGVEDLRMVVVVEAAAADADDVGVVAGAVEVRVVAADSEDLRDLAIRAQAVMTSDPGTYAVLKLHWDPKRFPDRDALLAAVWECASPHGLQGLDEGTILTEEAHELGLETESWVLDAGIAPHERDWLREQAKCEVLLYFNTIEEASQAGATLLGVLPGVEIASSETRPTQDWNEKWRASFQGIEALPGLWVLPPWRKDAILPERAKVLWIEPGAGFGTGTHETTRLCLRALHEAFRVEPSLAGARALDFGSGSGILSIACAALGAGSVLGVEIDPLANDNARENARTNGAEDRVRFQEFLPPREDGVFGLIVANILRPVLLTFAEELVSRLRPGGILVLSGLVEQDLPAIRQGFYALLKEPDPFSLLEMGEWRALAWRKSAGSFREHGSR